MDQDRRQYQRIATDDSVQLLDEESALPALALDVSLRGMQVLCDTPTADQVDRRMSEGDAEIHIRMPRANGGIDAWCRVVYTQRFPDDECRVGLQYARFVDGSYDWLEGFMDEGESFVPKLH